MVLDDILNSSDKTPLRTVRHLFHQHSIVQVTHTHTHTHVHVHVMNLHLRHTHSLHKEIEQYEGDFEIDSEVNQLHILLP